MKIHTGNGKCKTCGVKIPASELRCAEHERGYQAWLWAFNEPEDRTVYKPRRNGVLGLHDGLQQQHNGQFRFSRRGLRPGQELKFDD